MSADHCSRSERRRGSLTLSRLVATREHAQTRFREILEINAFVISSDYDPS